MSATRPTAPDGILYRLASRGDTHFDKQQYKEAITFYTKALIKTKTVAEEPGARDFIALVFANRSAAYFYIGCLVDSAKDAEVVVRLKPDWSKGYFRLAEAYFGLRRFKEAVDAYQKSVMLDPTCIEARTNLIKSKYLAEDTDNGIMILQLTPGKDIAIPNSYNPIQNKIYEYAIEMRNFVYIIADVVSRLCVVVDACWDAQGIMDVIKREKLHCIGAIVTHYHFDHVGGTPPSPFNQLPIKVTGLATMIKKWPNVRAYIHQEDIRYVRESNPEIDPNRIIPTTHDFELKLGTDSIIRFLHTPGHTPGSQCLLVNNNRLFSGDTLFLGTCGRLDLPGACKLDMFQSLQQVLKDLDDNTMVYPGHNYGGEWTTIAQEKAHGILRGVSREKWLATH
ncbi:Metallo-hydrolase/oxidoreductase [Basidiobolus meristosporus CBS 931.73]|uniref:Metallo-hydrolase/oxidoreductase n=1 Tax=Basidiobolus meristosporus CBS 931.73 TaxID=1314790 RepID=A0A1Y1Z1J8_9FUNG|nr:Metallo-hydrolase/oxidoreductase [Basidiobolus meristosporus CBS 931.73]|eukprot:ORY04160.1 Metallo-hydrolase/oxidoreductase [Basidiobolus meristosporus CBS 931.73]